ncbi:hypothetical protein DM01DRAFT_324271 [Hesseltinella vesiculosa]|uniref:Uncharacterized protein n=1 Tax=Hesseltinella vesiculosa TaxID=101127 RepID=A0A1X2G4S1_9FUNG|nr:hypothetical protein DM01DRAFT_324271 [Hesseltinella vesiculosa]
MFTPNYRYGTNIPRPNPIECIGCHHPCQQVIVYASPFQHQDITDNMWFAFFSSPGVLIAGLRHLVVDRNARLCTLHFATPASAYFFINSPQRWYPFQNFLGPSSRVEHSSVEDRLTTYHSDRHYPGHRCHHNYDFTLPPPAIPRYHLYHRHRRHRH